MKYTDFISEALDVIIIEHINYEGQKKIDNVCYSFFKSRNKFLHIPFKTIFYIKKQKPDIVLIQGAVFPIKVIILKLFLTRQSLIIVQHHGNLPFKGIKKIFQKIADRYTDAYLFTAIGNVKTWVDHKIIKNTEKCFEVLEASTFMKKQDKQECRIALKIENDTVFLWVGRLDVEKDPITILQGFKKYLNKDSQAKLYMIYQAETLLPEMKNLINHSALLKSAVTLVGKIPHEQLQYWYSAADFYVSGSHREAAGYALIESLACGCIPILSDIPPFLKIAGEFGFFFEKGNSDSVYGAILQASKVAKDEASSNIVNYFNNHLTFKTIADDILQICKKLTIKQLHH